MNNFGKICNISFVLYPKYTKEGVFVFPSVAKQLGKTKNYVIVVMGSEYKGIWSWDPVIIPELKTWMNKTTECYSLPISKMTFVKSLEDIDPELPLGGYITRIIKKIEMEHSDDKKRNN